jgi:hypothetical protein
MDNARNDVSSRASSPGLQKRSGQDDVLTGHHRVRAGLSRHLVDELTRVAGGIQALGDRPKGVARADHVGGTRDERAGGGHCPGQSADRDRQRAQQASEKQGQSAAAKPSPTGSRERHMRAAFAGAPSARVARLTAFTRGRKQSKRRPGRSEDVEKLAIGQRSDGHQAGPLPGTSAPIVERLFATGPISSRTGVRVKQNAEQMFVFQGLVV